MVLFHISQVFCIVGVWNDHIIPLAWVLMESRTEAAYTAVLQLLQNHMGPNIALNRAISDFETAEQNAWHNVFQVDTQGCMWHLARVCICLLYLVIISNVMYR